MEKKTAEHSKLNSSRRKDAKKASSDKRKTENVPETALESEISKNMDPDKMSIQTKMNGVGIPARAGISWKTEDIPQSELEESESESAICQSAGLYKFHVRKASEKGVTVVNNFERRMSRVCSLGTESEDSKRDQIKRKLSQRINVKILTEKLKKRVKGEKSERNFLEGKWKYLECLAIRWPKKISRNTLFHDYIFYAFAFALFSSDGYLLSCLLHGFGYEYNLYAMTVLSTAAVKKPNKLATRTTLYPISGIILLLILVSICSAIIGTRGYYTANRKYHYWYISLIGGMILVQCGIGLDVFLFKGDFCKEVKPYMDAKLVSLVRNYYTTSPVIRTPTEDANHTAKFIMQDPKGVPFRVRNFVDASLMDVLQTYYFCCGFSDYKDYLNASFYRFPPSDPRYNDWKPKIPKSCCTPKWNRNVACSSQVPKKSEELRSKLFQEGCSLKMNSVCINVFFYLGKGLLIFSAWQTLFFIICLLCIVIQIRQIKRLERSSRFKVDPKIMERPLETMHQREYRYDQTARPQQRTLDKSPNSNLLPKWYRDFLESYRTHRGQYIYNRMHAAKYGFEPHPATSIEHLRQQKLSLPLEKDSRGDTMPIATDLRPTFTKQFHEKYRDTRNEVVLSSYDRDINQWVTDIGQARKEKYNNPHELAIVQYNESDWEEKEKRKLLIESDVLAKYHVLAKEQPFKPAQAKSRKGDGKLQKKNNFVPFKRKSGYPQGPSYLKSSWYSPKGESTRSSLTEKAEESTLSELAKDPRSIFHRPDEDSLKREKEKEISWKIGKAESVEYIPKKKGDKIRRKHSVQTIQHNRFAAKGMETLSPPKVHKSVVDPIRLGNLGYKTPRPLKPAPLHTPPSEVSTVPESTLSQPSAASLHSDKSNSEVYHTYFGEELYRQPASKRKRDKVATFIVNPKSKVPFDSTYYRQEIPSAEERNRQVLETTETVHIGSVAEESENPKSYVNRRVQKWEEQAKKFKW